MTLEEAALDLFALGNRRRISLVEGNGLCSAWSRDMGGVHAAGLGGVGNEYRGTGVET